MLLRSTLLALALVSEPIRAPRLRHRLAIRRVVARKPRDYKQEKVRRMKRLMAALFGA